MNAAENVHTSELINLPEETLLHIFKFVNISSRYNVSQVCRKFYELICKLEKDCMSVEISYERICNRHIYNSIIYTLRKFSKMEIILSADVVEQIEYVLDILIKFGHRIKTFTISGRREYPKMFESQLVRMLNYIPNVEELTLQEICIENDMRWKDQLHLYKLKKLTIRSAYDCANDYSILTWNQLPKNVLTELYFISFGNEKCLPQLLNRQTQIIKLTLNATYFFNFREMIRQHPQLRSLDLSNGFNSNEDFKEICELKCLESLSICVGGISIDAFKSITKLMNLKELYMDYYMELTEIYVEPDDMEYDGAVYDYSGEFQNILSELCVMKLFKIEALSFAVFYEVIINQEIVVHLSKKFHDLKYLKFETSSIDVIGTVLKFFTKLETFEFIYGGCEQGQELVVIDEWLKHENLKEFKVGRVHEKNMKSILNAISACSNLELLEVSGSCQMCHEDLQQIVDDHQKLIHLTLKMGDFHFEKKTIELIQSAAKRLQSISLSRINWQRLCFETIKEFFKEEFPCITHSYNTLMMKKRLTMK